MNETKCFADIKYVLKFVRNFKTYGENIQIKAGYEAYKSVYVSNEATQVVNEYIQILDNTKFASKKLKMQINDFTLRYGFKYPGKSK